MPQKCFTCIYFAVEASKTESFLIKTRGPIWVAGIYIYMYRYMYIYKCQTISCFLEIGVLLCI